MSSQLTCVWRSLQYSARAVIRACLVQLLYVARAMDATAAAVALANAVASVGMALGRLVLELGWRAHGCWVGSAADVMSSALSTLRPSVCMRAPYLANKGEADSPVAV